MSEETKTLRGLLANTRHDSTTQAELFTRCHALLDRLEAEEGGGEPASPDAS